MLKESGSLDALISKHAAVFASHVRAAAKAADTEEDIRIAVENELDFIRKGGGVNIPKGKHEFTIAEGRIDSVYSRVIVEYKNPSAPGARIGDSLESPGAKKLIKQIQDRFTQFSQREGQPVQALLGVGCDGEKFIFIRWYAGAHGVKRGWDTPQLLDLDEHSSARFLWALHNLGNKGREYRPEYLAGDFGSESTLAQEGVRTLYHAILKATHPKAQTFFNQWKILFGEVCGYNVDDPSDKMKLLAKGYGITGKIHPAELLFAVHTYYAVFMKLLAGHIVVKFHQISGDPISKLLGATTPAKFKAEMEDLEKGSVFRHFNITNFLEGDLFAWYLPVWDDVIEKMLRDMVKKFDEYNPLTLAQEPTVSRDLLKKLYQELFPKKVRHDLGEYYTPDWLAEHTLNEVGYTGDPDKRVLDPACGSGTFLVLAINRIREWYEKNRETCGYEEADLCRKILANCIGFDLNPLAVMAARTNYLIAIRGLIHGLDKIEIPVYLCDSILTPSSYGGLFAGETGASKELKTAAAKFIVPVEIASSATEVGTYAEVLETCVRNGYSPKEFLERCEAEGLKVTKERLHTDLYKELVALDKANKNGVWARIIKNSFAPLFVRKVDFVVGNPPWVNWESLPSDYRDATLPLWDLYRLRERAIRGSRLGNVKRELSALFVYVCTDHYLKDGGVLGFVVTQSVFKTGANEGFRRFRLASDRPFAVEQVHDLSLFLPFEGAINRTAVLVSRAAHPTNYPVQYRLWVPKARRESFADLPLASVTPRFRIQKWLASPVEPSVRESPWLTAPEAAISALQKVIGDRSEHTMKRTYAGSCTWLNGVFWVETDLVSKRSCVIRNLANIGKRAVEQCTHAIEADLVYPLLRGRDVKAWIAEPSIKILVPHEPDSFSRPIPLAKMKRDYHQAFDYFKNFEKQLRARSGYKQLFKDSAEFYVVGNVAKYTLAPYKVVFKELTDVFQCAVVGPRAIDGVVVQPTIPDHKLLFVTCETEIEAMFLAGLLNSIPARAALYCSSVGVQTQSYYPTDVSRVRLPTYRAASADHVAVVRLSRQCHKAAAHEGRGLAELEADLAIAAARIWSITASELKILQAFYDDVLTFRGSSSDRDTND